jgi:hypothetical protein
MHATNVERNSWRLPPDDTVQVADQRSKSAEVSLISDCTLSSNSDTVKTGLPTPQPLTGHDPTAVPHVLYSYNALHWVLDPPLLNFTSPEGSPLKFLMCPLFPNAPIHSFILWARQLMLRMHLSLKPYCATLEYSFSSDSAALCLLWRGKGLLLRLFLFLLVRQTDSQRRCSTDQPAPRSSK